MKIFITGIAGFLGAHLADALRSLGHEAYGCDIAMDEFGSPFVDICNCRDFPAMKYRMGGADVVVHCAALPHEGLSVFSPSTITNSIYSASVSVFSAAIAAGVRRIVNCSSMSRYGAIPSPFHESDDPKPVDPYGIAKLAAERTLECLAKVHGVEYVTAVPHNIYGPRQCRSDPYRNVIAIMMNRILQGKPPVIYGGGHQRRCFSYISDVIPCLVQMVTSDNRDILGRIINIGPDTGEVSIGDLCEIVSMEMNYDCPPIYYHGRPAEVAIANCSGELSRGLFGCHAKTSLQDGVHLMAEWMRSVGPKEFDYKLPLEIITAKTPKTWTNKEI
jgi:UDP-glucose 4-epimerase